jgi:hypothetical protein
MIVITFKAVVIFEQKRYYLELIFRVSLVGIVGSRNI